MRGRNGMGARGAALHATGIARPCAVLARCADTGGAQHAAKHAAPAAGAHLSNPPPRVLGAGGQQDIAGGEVGVHKAALGVDEAQGRGQLYGCKAQGGGGARWGREAAGPLWRGGGT